MPFADLSDVRLHYRLDGPEHAPVLVLSNSLGTNLDMWAPQMPALTEQFRVLRYDTRGHGESSLPAQSFGVAQLGDDVIGLLDHLGIAHAHFCGLSMGGMTGLWLAINAPSRVDRMVLANTGAKIGSTEFWNARIAQAMSGGRPAMLDAVIERWFSARHRALSPAAIAPVRRMLEDTPPAGYAANCAAIRDTDLRADMKAIQAPVLVIAGALDPSTPPELGREIAAAIAGAQYVALDAAHLSNIEQAGAFTAALMNFLTEGAMSERARLACGMSMRRAVLGDAYVERSIAARTALTDEFQDFITRMAWGTVWTRPGLPRHTRSLMTIAMMVALNRPEELRLHLNAARNNGVTRDEIKETLLQAAVYCGVPAANAAFHLAAQVFAEQDAQDS